MRTARRLLAAVASLAGLAACGPSATPAPTCTSFTYSAFGACQPGNTQTRTVLASSPIGCTGGAPITAQACTYLGGGTDDPIAAPEEQWTWVGFPGAVCGNGQTTGLGVNPTSRSGDVVVYFQGGGACWDGLTCLGLGSAVNIRSGYGAAAFAAEPQLAATAFGRGEPANPLRNASYVFIPYCTGDLHSGDAVRTYPWLADSLTVHHAGRANVAAFLRRLAPTFPGTRRVYVTGSSGGGYGAQLQYLAFAAAFPAAEVHLLADGAQLVQPTGSLWSDWRAAWSLALPAGCTDCAAQPGALVTYLATTHPDRRFALLASVNDQVLTAFFGYGFDTTSFGYATLALLEDRYAPADNAHAFSIATSTHTMLGGLTTTTDPGGVALSDWIGRWYSGDAAWADVGP
jgi:hypothetical protein